MTRETSRQQRVLQARETRRRERREHKREQSLSLSLQQQQQQLPHETECSANFSTTAGSDRETRSKTASTGGGSGTSGSNKFLKIRSWREIYGTGEGKELARQHQHHHHQQQQQKDEKERSAVPVASESGTLDGKKRSSQAMLDTCAAAGAVAECQADEAPNALSAPVHPSLPAVLASFEEYTGGVAPFDLEHYQLEYARYAPPPPPPPELSTSPPCSGAFMQEVDGDDELFSDFDGSSAFERDARSSGTGVPESDEFVDHGLSYYYDPAIAQLVPPPPPPPPPPPLVLEDGESDDEFYDTALNNAHECDESGDCGSFIPPPPPPPPYVLEPYTTSAEMASRPPQSLLQAIQLGTSLRHIKVRCLSCHALRFLELSAVASRARESDTWSDQIDEEGDGDDDDRGDGDDRSPSRKRHGSPTKAAAPTLLEQIKMVRQRVCALALLFRRASTSSRRSRLTPSHIVRCHSLLLTR